MSAQIPEFFAGRSVLITGASGFMGKVLVERLLSTCPDIGRLYLLLRDKRGASPAARLADLKASPVFDPLRLRHPARLERLRAVPGDIAQPGLGIPPEYLRDLEEVSVVFNCAATVKFDETLRRAVELNVLSVTRLLDLADRLGNVKAFVHVSTAYCAAERREVAERVYELPRALHRCIEDALSLPDDTPPEDVRRYIWPKPNTYTFTKTMGEAAVQQHGNKGYPIAIFRPTIVISSLQQPLAGWAQGHHGPLGAVRGITRGVLHVFAARAGARADLLPVDRAIDALIAVAWETAVDNSPTVRVYNCSSSENPTTWGELRTHVLAAARTHPTRDIAGYPYLFYFENRFLYNIMTFVVQTAPLYLAEMYLRLTNKKGEKKRMDLIKLSASMKAATRTLCYFTTREWTFHCDHIRRLRERLTPADREIYQLDFTTINWPDCYEKMVHSTRRYLAGHGDETLPEARAKLRRYYIIHQCLRTLLSLLALRLVLKHRSWLLGTAGQLVSTVSHAFLTTAAALARYLPLPRS